MSLAFVGASNQETDGSATNTVTYSPVAGNQVVVFVLFRENSGVASTSSSPTDNATGGSSTYRQVFQSSNFDNTANNYNTAVFYCASVKSGVTTVTAQFSASTVNSFTIVAEYSGGTDSVDQSNGSAFSATSSAAVSSAISTSKNNNEIVMGFFVQKDSSSFTFSSSAPSTLRNSGSLVINGAVACIVDQIVSAEGTYHAQVNISSSAHYWAWIVTFAQARPALDVQFGVGRVPLVPANTGRG